MEVLKVGKEKESGDGVGYEKEKKSIDSPGLVFKRK